MMRAVARGALAAFVLLHGLAPSIARADASCNVTATSVAFGTYDPLLALPDDSAGTVTVTCTYRPPGERTVLYTVKLGPGQYGSLVQRQLAAGAARMRYNLFIDAARATIWGDGTAGTAVASGRLKPGPGVGNAVRTATHTIYGRVPAQQDVGVGQYGDTLLVTLEF